MEHGTIVHLTPDPKKLVVGFDTRFLSDRFAAEVARVLAANGFTVFLTNADAPTPAISFAVRNLNAMGGVMITASHNAPRYNGVKLKSAYGGSALPEQCRRVEVYLNDNENQGRAPNSMDYDEAIKARLMQRFNPIPTYNDHLRTLMDVDKIAENPQRIVVDSMYGAGRGIIKGILQGTGCEVTEIRGEMNPGFGGVHPEPIAKFLSPSPEPSEPIWAILVWPLMAMPIASAPWTSVVILLIRIKSWLLLCNTCMKNADGTVLLCAPYPPPGWLTGWPINTV